MEVVPLLHIKDGRPVLGGPGEWRPVEPPYPDGGDDLAGLVRHLFVRFGSVAVVDLGTGRSDEPHLNLYQRLVKHNVEVWVDAYPRTLEDVMDLFVAGAERVTVRLDRFDDDDLDDVLAMAEGEVWLGLPFRTLAELDRLVQKKAPQQYLERGAAGTVLIDLTAASTGRGGDADVLDHAPEQGPRYVTGGIRSPEAADRLASAGADGVLVGTALFSDLDTWARRAQDARADDGPRTVGTSSASVTVEQRPGILPGVVPDRPPRPTVDKGDEGR